MHVFTRAQAAMISKRYELYYNENRGEYPYTILRPYATNTRNTRKEIISNGAKKHVFITGIPDGISEFTNTALIERGFPRRLAISSNVPLTEAELSTIDAAHHTMPYPIPIFADPIDRRYNDQPNANFVMSINDSIPSSVSRYIEYRYFATRHVPATILYNPHNGHVHRFVPPSSNIVLIMPENFTKTATNRGFFVVGENLIVRIYSKRPLSAAVTLPDHNLYSEISVASGKTLELAKRILMNLGLHKIVYQSHNQIYGSDAFVTAVIGNIANINLPKYE